MEYFYVKSEDVTSHGLTLRGDVAVSKALQGRVKPGQVIYVVAKSVNSPGMRSEEHTSELQSR
jgi:hypothetical protein